MIMTEQEARDKWCPMSRSFGPHGSSGNRNLDGSVQKADHCLGTGCPMWRWMMALMQIEAHEPREGWEHVYGEDREYWLEPPAEAMKRRRGFCGLAGVPHDA